MLGRSQLGGDRWIQDGEVQTDEDEDGEDRVPVLHVDYQGVSTGSTGRNQSREEEPEKNQRKGEGTASGAGPTPKANRTSAQIAVTTSTEPKTVTRTPG